MLCRLRMLSIMRFRIFQLLIVRALFFTMCMCVLRVYDVSLLGHIDNRNIVYYDISVISGFG
jgi:hypothetical protein